MSLPEIDGPSREVFERVVTQPETIAGLRDGFAALCGAAAWAAMLLAEHDDVHPNDQSEWRGWGLLLLGEADLWTLGSDCTREDVLHLLLCTMNAMYANDITPRHGS